MFPVIQKEQNMVLHKNRKHVEVFLQLWGYLALFFVMFNEKCLSFLKNIF